MGILGRLGFDRVKQSRLYKLFRLTCKKPPLWLKVTEVFYAILKV